MRLVLGDRLTTVTFDSVTDVGGAREDPDLFLQNHPPPLFLDEIQYAPELTGAIKRYVDTHREPGLFVLSGSQQLRLSSDWQILWPGVWHLLTCFRCHGLR